jgi:hypothetical protein
MKREMKVREIHPRSLWRLVFAGLLVLCAGSTAYPQATARSEIKQEIGNDIHKVEELLSNPAWVRENHRAIASEVQAFLGHRILGSPVGYEGQPEFSVGVSNTYKRFAQAFDSGGDGRFEVRDLDAFVSQSIASYDENATTFDTFYKKYYSAGHEAQVRQMMLTFSMVVYLSDRTSWLQSSAGSHFWPFCHAIH